MLLTSIIFIITTSFKDVLANQDVVEQCCEQGKSQVANGGCGNFSVPIDNVDSEHQNLCIATMEICCLTAERSESCSKGQKSAKDGLTCDSNPEEPCGTDSTFKAWFMNGISTVWKFQVFFPIQILRQVNLGVFRKQCGKVL